MNNFLSENDFWTPPQDLIIPTKNWIANPSFETNTSNWATLGSTTLTKTDGDGVYGNSCCMITATNSTSSSVYRDTPVANGSNVLFDAILSVWAKAGTHNKMALAVSTIGSTITLTNDWVRYKFIKPGVQSTRVIIYPKSPFSTESGTIYIDGVQYELLPAGTLDPTDYCDGDQANCIWLGTAHASLSQRGTPTLP